MPTYRVRVRALIYRTYEVEAADQKAAIAATGFADPISEEEEDAEAMSAIVIAPFDTEKEAQEAAFHAKLP